MYITYKGINIAIAEHTTSMRPRSTGVPELSGNTVVYAGSNNI